MARDQTYAGIAFVAVCVGLGAILALGDQLNLETGEQIRENKQEVVDFGSGVENRNEFSPPPSEDWEGSDIGAGDYSIFAGQSEGMVTCEFPNGNSLPVEWNAGSRSAVARGAKSSVAGRLVDRAGPGGEGDESFIEIDGFDDGGEIYLFISADGKLSGQYNGEALTGWCN